MNDCEDYKFHDWAWAIWDNKIIKYGDRHFYNEEDSVELICQNLQKAYQEGKVEGLLKNAMIQFPENSQTTINDEGNNEPQQ
jgi:hypothetical protein